MCLRGWFAHLYIECGVIDWLYTVHIDIYIYISTKSPSYWSYLHQLSYLGSTSAWMIPRSRRVAKAGSFPKFQSPLRALEDIVGYPWIIF